METQGVPYTREIPCATTGNTYASVMVALRENKKQKRRGKLSDGVLLLHDNAPHRRHTHRGLL